MADYKFDKPWAADSVNVKEFTEEEWREGIPFKSLAESKVVNGVMKEVTNRFLELEAVEDRQYRYDFIVKTQEDWNKFIEGNTGNAQSVLIRKGQVWTATQKVTLKRVGVIAQEEGSEIRFNAGLERQPSSPAIISGGVIRGDLTNCRVLYATVTTTKSAIYHNAVFENSYVYTESDIVSLAYGHYSRSVINVVGTIMNAKLTDCEIKNVGHLENCTIVRCIIPANTKLEDCTLIDCDYTVDTYIANLVTGTTFRNCNVSITTTGTGIINVFSGDCAYENCKISLNANNSRHIQGEANNCEFDYNSSLSLKGALVITGNSFMTVSNDNIADILGKMNDNIIRTDLPFYRNNINVYTTYEASGDIIHQGVINIVTTNADKNLPISTTPGVVRSVFVRYTGPISNKTTTYNGSLQFVHVNKTLSGRGSYIKMNI